MKVKVEISDATEVSLLLATLDIIRSLTVKSLIRISFASIFQKYEQKQSSGGILKTFRNLLEKPVTKHFLSKFSIKDFSINFYLGSSSSHTKEMIYNFH